MKFFNSKKSIIFNNFDTSIQNKNEFFLCNRLKIKKFYFCQFAFFHLFILILLQMSRRI